MSQLHYPQALPASAWGSPFGGMTRWDGSPAMGYDDPEHVLGAFETQVEVELSPTTSAQIDKVTARIDDVNDTIEDSVDKVIASAGTGLKYAAATLVVLGFIGAATLLLRK